MTTAESTSTSQRIIAVVVLVLVGALSLPVTAAFLDEGSTEDLIIPVQLALVALIGAVVGYLLPGLGGPDSARGRSAGIGAVLGLVVALVGVAVFALLLG